VTTPCRVLMVVDEPCRPSFNCRVFGRELQHRGAVVLTTSINHLQSLGSDVVAPTYGAPEAFDDPLAKFTVEDLDVPIAGFDLIWILNQPHPEIAMDVWRLLWLGTRSTKCVNDITGLVFLNNKITLPAMCQPDHLGFNLVGWDPEWLVTRAPHQDLVVKPTASGCGMNVFRLPRGDTNGRVILDMMTGNGIGERRIRSAKALGHLERYCVVQPYVASAADGVARILTVTGEYLAGYVKRPPSGSHRSNGGELVAFEGGTMEQREIAEAVANRLLGYGVRFAAFDMVGNQVLEVNLINPGGLQHASPQEQQAAASRGIDRICHNLTIEL
jgi:glutathione synthase